MDLQNTPTPRWPAWAAFAHPDHQTDELDSLVRTLRYAMIDLQKFWVELQSIPVFMNGLKACSLEEIERIFQWVLSASAWSERIAHPRLIAELARPETRKKIQDFARAVICVNSIREELETKLGNVPSDRAGLEKLWGLLNEAKRIVQRQEASALSSSALEERIEAFLKNWEEVKGVQGFFQAVVDQTGAPLPSHASEGVRVLKALDSIRKMPAAVIPWRTRFVLDPAQRIRLQAWRDRARPTLEQRKRLEQHFDLSADVDQEELWTLSETLKADGILNQFRAPYREALERYRALLKDKAAQKQDGKLTGYQKAEKLLEWIGLIDQVRSFAQQAEARAAFAPNFKGIDTDFPSALEASAWAQAMRGEIFNAGSETRSLAFDTSLLEFVTQVPEGRISAVRAMIEGDPASEVAAILEKPEFQAGLSFHKIEEQRARSYLDFKRLREIAEEIGLDPQASFAGLDDWIQRVEEAFVLIRGMESDETLRASLKEVYAGAETDLSAIEPCASYVKAVRTASLSEEVEHSLLSAHGPQRLDDARGLVRRCLVSMEIVREHYRKVETATRGRVRSICGDQNLEAAPIVELMDRIQSALKEAQHLGDAVSDLRTASSVRPVFENAQR